VSGMSSRRQKEMSREIDEKGMIGSEKRISERKIKEQDQRGGFVRNLILHIGGNDTKGGMGCQGGGRKRR